MKTSKESPSKETNDQLDEDLFYFESDHLALRGNQDYSSVLRSIVLLEAQRIRVLKQLEELELSKKRYLDEPQLLLEKLQRNEEIIAPNYMTVVKIPEVGKFEHLFKNDPPEVKIEPIAKTSTCATTSSVAKVRGRAVDETKPEKFNQLWTYEEQQRLEKLLVEYPEEEIESRRYAKIAQALGNRTALQVQSRVQKYFQKLHEVGMPVPGRKPKYRRMGYLKPKHVQRRSTFFPAFNVPVHMSEDDFFGDDPTSVPPSVASPNCPNDTPGTHTSNVASATCATIKTEYEPAEAAERRRTLELLKAIREEKVNTADGYNPDPMAAKCEDCQLAAVSRTRWHCNTCCYFLNLCLDCLIGQLVARRFEHILHDVGVEQDV